MTDDGSLLQATKARVYDIDQNRPGSLGLREKLGPECRHFRERAMPSAYDTDLDRNPANFQPLTPLSLIARAAGIKPN